MSEPSITRIEIDQDRCISSGRCVADEPSLFAFDVDELATVVGSVAAHTTDRLILPGFTVSCTRGSEVVTQVRPAMDLTITTGPYGYVSLRQLPEPATVSGSFSGSLSGYFMLDYLPSPRRPMTNEPSMA